MARRTKLTVETQARIERAISVGATYEAAAASGGVTYETFNNWMKRGEAAKSGIYFEFFNAIKKAEADAQIRWLAQIEQASQGGTWQAAAWKLERRYPEQFGRTVVRNEHTDADGNELKILVEYANRKSNDT